MAKDQESRVRVNGMDEATPLLPSEPTKEPSSWSVSPFHRILFCGFIVSISFGVTQVPLIYVFRLMTCDAYYETHQLPPVGADRCSVSEIEAKTARAVSLLGASTTFFGVGNLFVTNWTIKKYGVKSALFISVFWPAVRLAIQNIGVMTGSNKGMLIIQLSQVITIIGGPSGYLLALNTFVTEIIEHKERTGALGQLHGCNMFGTAVGFLTGGLLSDAFGILSPFRVTLSLFLISSIYVLLFLPWITPDKSQAARSSQGLSQFFGPLRTFVPRKWIMHNGQIRREFGAIILGFGSFTGVLATSYVPTLLQMYSTDVFGFGTTENGWLIAIHGLLRGVFLTIAFPRIISTGRRWLENKDKAKNVETGPPKASGIPDIPTRPNEIPAPQGVDQGEEPVEPPEPRNEQETFDFDLFFTRFSLLADGILTGVASFVGRGWQLYMVAALLPFASGTGAASKGSILQMCPPAERTDALSAITLIELIARLITTSVFGLVFAAFADIGKLYLVFTCNAGVAILGFCILMFSRFPPDGSIRLDVERSEVSTEET